MPIPSQPVFLSYRNYVIYFYSLSQFITCKSVLMPHNITALLLEKRWNCINRCRPLLSHCWVYVRINFTINKTGQIDHCFMLSAAEMVWVVMLKVNVCLGYDIRTESGYDEMMDDLERFIGLNYLKAVHINDSKGCLWVALSWSTLVVVIVILVNGRQMVQVTLLWRSLRFSSTSECASCCQEGMQAVKLCSN